MTPVVHMRRPWPLRLPPPPEGPGFRLPDPPWLTEAPGPGNTGGLTAGTLPPEGLLATTSRCTLSSSFPWTIHCVFALVPGFTQRQKKINRCSKRLIDAMVSRQCRWWSSPLRTVVTPLPLSRDAATVVGLAGTALSFAESTDDEVERWLRALRLYGEAGSILQSMAVGEAPLTPSAPRLRPHPGRPEETVAAITAAAATFAAQRNGSAVGTVDVLVAVMRHYGDAFEQALESRGSDRWELVERVSGSLHAPLR